MKRFALILVLAATTAVGCNDNDDSAAIKQPKPVWESYSHAQLFKFSGAVKQVTRTYSGKEASTTVLTAQFDAKGNCTVYNPTGIEITGDFSGETRGDWGIEAVWYTYTYDGAGRMSCATKYEVGSDPMVYSITYGSHDNYIPAPFALGDIEPLLLKGVTRIEAPGYLLVADDLTAIATRTIGGWRPVIEKTTFNFSDNLPVKQTAVTYPGESDREQERTETTYTYDRNWLVRMEKTTSYPGDESNKQRFATQFSSQWPFMIIAKEGYAGAKPTPEFRIEYKYAENGQPMSAAYATGMFYYGEFTQHYTAYDTTGNWISGVRGENGTEIETAQTLTYY